MKKDTKIVFVPFVLLLLVSVFCLVGWGMNLYKLTQCDFESPYKAEACRAVGVFVAPVGVIEGYITIEDGKK